MEQTQQQTNPWKRQKDQRKLTAHTGSMRRLIQSLEKMRPEKKLISSFLCHSIRFFMIAQKDG